MTRKPKTINADDLKTKLLKDGKLSHEAIEKFLILSKEIESCYTFAHAASPTDIFKPHKTPIKDPADAGEYFRDSFDKYHEAKESMLHELWHWFEAIYFKDCQKSGEYLGAWEYDQGIYDFEVRYIYVKKFSQLPFEYVCNSFKLNKDRFAVNPLEDFFSKFDDYFYRSWFDVGFDWEGMRHYYESVSDQS